MNVDAIELLRREFERLPEPEDELRERARGRLLAEIAQEETRRRRRRLLPSGPGRTLLAAALLLGLLGAVPAIAGDGYGRLFRFLAGEPSPRLEQSLREMEASARERGSRHVPLAAQTQKVFEARRREGVFRIWLTPTRERALCLTLELPRSIGTTCGPGRARKAIDVTTLMSGGTNPVGQAFIQGQVTEEIASLELRYVNGAREQIPLQGGLFLAVIDPIRIVRGSDHPAELIGRDSAGEVVAREDVSGHYEQPVHGVLERPPIALEPERSAIEVPLGEGEKAELRLSPDRGGGTCSRLVARELTWSWNCTGRRGVPRPIRWELSRIGGARTSEVAILIRGVAQPGVEVEFRYQDGAREEIRLVDRHFLVRLPEARWAPGKRLQAIVALADNRERMRVPIASEGDAFYRGPPDRLATLDQATSLLRVSGPNGATAELLVAPASDGGECVVIKHFLDRHHAGEGVRCTGRAWTGPPLQLSSQFLPPRFIGGRVRADVESVRIRFADGSSRTLSPTRGYVLWAAPKEHLTTESGAVAAEGLGADGQVVGRISFKPPRR